MVYDIGTRILHITDRYERKQTMERTRFGRKYVILDIKYSFTFVQAEIESADRRTAIQE